MKAIILALSLLFFGSAQSQQREDFMAKIKRLDSATLQITNKQSCDVSFRITWNYPPTLEWTSVVPSGDSITVAIPANVFDVHVKPMTNCDFPSHPTTTLKMILGGIPVILPLKFTKITLTKKTN